MVYDVSQSIRIIDTRCFEKYERSRLIHFIILHMVKELSDNIFFDIEALAERSAGSGRQGKLQSRGQMVQAELSCPYRFRLDEPRNRKEPKAQ